MIKNKQFLGIDISKDVFDVVDKADNHYQFQNDPSGFKMFSKILTDQSHCVIEVTGCYYQTLATWLYSKSIDVSVVNPLSIKRFIQILAGAETKKGDPHQYCICGSCLYHYGGG